MTADVAPLSPEELAEARTRHSPRGTNRVFSATTMDWEKRFKCVWCDTLWPCDAARAIATVDALAVRRETRCGGD